MPDTTVKYFDSTMSEAPSLSGLAGTLINVLDACLVTGFGEVAVNELIVVNNVATATVSLGHGFTMHGNTGPVIRIRDASPSALNGDWRTTITGTTTFTFATTGITNQTATGTIFAKRSPAGFSKAFTGTNLAAYRADEVSSTRMFLRIDDTTIYSAGAIGFSDIADQTAFDNATGSDPFPSSSNYGIARSFGNLSSSTSRPWIIIADDRAFYMHVDYNSNGVYYTMSMFGDINSFSGVDNYQCVLARSVAGAGGTAPAQGGPNSGLFSNVTGTMILPRSYTQLSGAVSAYLGSTLMTTWGATGTTIAYPDVVDNSLIIADIFLFQSSAILRGKMPGLYATLNIVSYTTGLHKTVFSNIDGLPGRDIMLLNGQQHSGMVGFDITGPWR